MSSNSIPLSDLEGSSPAAKFEHVGDKVVGRIESMNHRQQTEFGTGKPLFFESGDPKMQWVIALKTADGDVLSVYARGGNFDVGSGTGESMLGAIANAIRAAGANTLEVGGQLAVLHSGLGKPRSGLNPPKLFTAQYQAPAPSPTAQVQVEDLFG